MSGPGPTALPAPDGAGSGDAGPGDGPPWEAFAVALAELPFQTPARLRFLLQGRSPREAWSMARSGSAVVDQVRGRRLHSPEGLARAWAASARVVDVEQRWQAYAAAGVRVHLQGGPGYPEIFADDPDPPVVVFSVGSLSGLDGPRVAVIGTRSATHYGQEVAAELGAGLAAAGVSVVSGLALGIDGAAHTGALTSPQAPPLGVVGSGLDVIYPPSHARLWSRLVAAGGLVSESPLGARPEGWRFPWRNRLLAAVADVVVVVESHRGGGSLVTAEAAARRGVPVMAVPGSVRSPASEGTNALLADGCAPARDTDDVLAALGLCRAARAPSLAGQPREVGPPARSGPQGADASVWMAIDLEPTPTGTVLRRTGMELGQLAVALDRLERQGWARAGDGWWERLT